MKFQIARWCSVLVVWSCLVSCRREPNELESARLAPAPLALPSAGTESVSPPAQTPVQKLDFVAYAMGTRVQIVALTNEKVDAAASQRAFEAALAEVRRLEDLMTTFRESELTRVNRGAGQFQPVSPETYEVIERGLWAGKISEGTFDISFHTLGDLWKFGSAAEPNPTPPSRAEAKRRAALIDYRLIELDAEGLRVRVPPGRSIDLGGIAKGYAVDRAASVLRERGLRDFLVQAGGDLYGSGRRLDGSPWVSGVQDPRGEPGSFFAILPLDDHAFSTAGDYARSFLFEGQRYHHIIDPRTGYPADASRSVTVWAPTALLADALDDAVFILGPEEGLALIESIEGVGALIVDRDNRVWVSRRLEGKVQVLRPPTSGL